MLRIFVILSSVATIVACPYHCAGAGFAGESVQNGAASGCGCCSHRPAVADLDGICGESESPASELPMQDCGCNCFCGGAVAGQPEDDAIDSVTLLPAFDALTLAVAPHALTGRRRSDDLPMTRVVSGRCMRHLLQSLLI